MVAVAVVRLFAAFEPNRQAHVNPPRWVYLMALFTRFSRMRRSFSQSAMDKGHIRRHRAGEPHVFAFRDRDQRLAHELGQIDEIHGFGQKLVLFSSVLGNDEDVVHHVQQKGGIRFDFAHGLAGLGR